MREGGRARERARGTEGGTEGKKEREREAGAKRGHLRAHDGGEPFSLRAVGHCVDRLVPLHLTRRRRVVTTMHARRHRTLQIRDRPELR
eukprot:674128-Rhodomonas_salina.1